MGLSVFSHDMDKADFSKSPVYGSCGFSISLAGPSTISKFDSINGKGVTTIRGICDDVNGISYSVTWENGPGALFVEKIKDFTHSEAFKLFGGHNHFDPNPATGQWTQLYPKEGCNLTINLKFRAYLQGGSGNASNYYANTSSYLTIIPWLTYLTSPQHKFDVSVELDNIANAMSNAKQQGEEFGEKLNSLVKDNRIDLTKWESVAKYAKGIEERMDKLVTGNDSQNVMLQVGDLIKPSASVTWVIENFNFTPSIYLGQTDSNSIGMPLYCDFNVSLTTNTKLSNKALTSILNV